MADRPFTILSTGSLGPPGNRASEKEDHPDSIVIEDIPFIRIVLNSDEHTRYQVLGLAEEKQVVVFTSANAVAAVGGIIRNKPDWTIYCVGDFTRKRAEAAFDEARIAGTERNAGDLAVKMIGDKVKRAVFFCGDQRRDVLPDKLKEFGIPMQELVVYQTQATPVRLKKVYDAVLFFSPTAVTSFFSINTLSRQTVLFALGGTTAGALRRFSSKEVMLPPAPDKASLFQMAIAYAQLHPII